MGPPLSGETVSHDVSLLLAFQAKSEVTVTAKEPANAVGLCEVGATVSTAAACVTVTVRLTPALVTVMVALRSAPVVFAVKLIANTPFSSPLAAATVSHAVLLLVAVHGVFVFDVTVRSSVPAGAVTLGAAGITVTVAAACVTVMVRVIPPPATVMVPLRDAPVVFMA